MAVSKEDFSKYAASRKNSELSKVIEKKKYSHNKVFDSLDITQSKPNKPESGQIHYISPSQIENWEYSDRLSTSLGDIDGLANEFIKIGQQQPCLIRKSKTNDNLYELIIGERRWRAAKKANVDLMVIIKDINDHDAALAQAAENDNRENLSDYEKGTSLAKLIAAGKIKQKDLIESLGKSRQYISSLLSFDKIPNELLEEIGDIKNFSAAAAERVKQIYQRSEQHKEAILLLAKKYHGKSPGIAQLERDVEEVLLNGKLDTSLHPVKLKTKDGRHVGTWGVKNKTLALSIPIDIYRLIQAEKINFSQLNSKIIKVIEMELNNLRE